MIVLSIPILMLRIFVNLGSHRLSYGPVLKVLATNTSSVRVQSPNVWTVRKFPLPNIKSYY